MALWLLGGLLVAGMLTAVAVLGSVKGESVQTFTSHFTETDEMVRTHAIGGMQLPSLSMMLYLCAAVTFGLTVIVMPRATLRPWMIGAIVLVAVGMRAPMFAVPHRGGVDFNRYLWDGAMSAHGRNPYQYSPRQLLDMLKPTTPVKLAAPWQGQQAGSEVSVDRRAARTMIQTGAATATAQTQLDAPDAELEQLIREGSTILGQCNHPTLRTPYPPAAQGMFALAYRIAPFSLNAWRAVLAGFDVLAAIAVLGLLWRSRLPLAAWSVYLWNPLLVMEIYYSGHMEIAVAAAVAIFAWLLVSGRLAWAAAALAWAAAAKAWPLLLGAFLVRAGWRDKRRLAVAMLVLGVLVAATMIPYTLANRGNNSGPGTYAKTSHDNYLAHWVFDRVDQKVLGPMGLIEPTSDELGHRKLDQYARMMGSALTVLAALWIGLRRPSSRADVTCLRLGAVMILYLLLGPTTYPWYYVGIIPLAAVSGRPSLMAWSVLLPMAYFPRALFPQTVIFGDGPLMMLVHLPVWILLGLELVRWPRWQAAGESVAA